nr:dihydrofolate reductase [uncultured bacterium]
MKVSVVAAITADGFIGRDAHHLSDWTSKEDKQVFVRLTKEAGTIVMGSKTYATIGRPLPGRRNIVYTTRPNEFQIEGVEATSEEPAMLVARLEQEGATGLAVCGGASIYGQFMRAGVVTDLYLTIEPVLFGTGVPLCNAELDTRLALRETSKLNENTILLHYSVLQKA